MNPPKFAIGQRVQAVSVRTGQILVDDAVILSMQYMTGPVYCAVTRRCIRSISTEWSYGLDPAVADGSFPVSERSLRPRPDDGCRSEHESWDSLQRFLSTVTEVETA